MQQTDSAIRSGHRACREAYCSLALVKVVNVNHTSSVEEESYSGRFCGDWDGAI